MAAAALCAANIQGQLFSQTFDLGQLTGPIVTIDTGTGAIRRVAAIESALAPAGWGLDPASRRLFLLDFTPRLQIVDLDSGRVSGRALTSCLVCAPVNGRMHFDPASQRLISVNGDVWLIDPETGTVSYFWNLVFVPTATAFDPVARRIFALAGSPGPAQTVEIFDMATKEAKFIEIASIRYYGFLEWDPVSRRLLSATSEQGVPIVSIDPETSLVETLVNTGSNILPYRSALDVQGGRLFFLSFVVAPGTPFNTAWSLYTVNLRNRSVTAVQLDTQTSYGLLEFAPGAAPVPPAVPVPMLNLAGMLIFGVGIAAAGFILIRWIR